jgi:1,2-diacylglycerol 3-alpha-glucosyltransferase
MVVNNFFPPRPGGSSYFSHQLAQNFAKFGHVVTVITTAQFVDQKFDLNQEFKIHRLPFWTLPKTRFSFNFDIAFALKIRNFFKIRRILKEFQPDVIHLNGQFFDLTWILGIFARFYGITTILTMHTRLISPYKLTNLCFYLIDKSLINLLLKLIKPSSYIAIDNDFIEYMLNRYRISRDKIKYIPIGIDVAKFESVKKDYSLGIKLRIASVGHIIPVRDRVLLIRAMPDVLKVFPSMKVDIIGGNYFDKFEDECLALNLKDSIELSGSIPNDLVISKLMQCDLEIHDLQNFGVGISSLEAMALGIVVIMKVRPDYFPHAILKSGENCILLTTDNPQELAKTILTQLDDPQRLSTIGENARNFVFKNFNNELISKEYLALFEKSCNFG